MSFQALSMQSIAALFLLVVFGITALSQRRRRNFRRRFIFVSSALAIFLSYWAVTIVLVVSSSYLQSKIADTALTYLENDLLSGVAMTCLLIYWCGFIMEAHLERRNT